MHKQIHYERTLALDEMANSNSEIVIKSEHEVTGEVKIVGEMPFTIEALFTEINRTWSAKLDYYDLESPFRDIPVAFQTNEYLLMYLATYMKGVRKQNSLENFTLQTDSDGNIFNDDRIQAQDVLKTMVPNNDNEARILGTIFHEYWAMYSFWMNKERVYKISSGLVDGLLETEYPALGNSLRSPHDTLYLLLPVDKSFKLPATDRVVEGIYVSYIRNPISDWADGSILSCYMTERPRSMDDIHDPRSHFFNMRIDHSKKLDKIVKEGVMTLSGFTADDRDMNIKHDVLSELVPIVRLVVNSLLYMTSTNADIIPRAVPVNKAPTEKRLRKFPHRVKSRKDYNTLGSDIIISRNGEERAGTAVIGTGSRHSYRYEVRAHFSHYWVKEENLPENITPDKITGEKVDEFGDKKFLIRTWLKKYMRGDEMAEVILKDYKLKEPK